MSLLLRRHFSLTRGGEIIYIGGGTTPADNGANTSSPVTITPIVTLVGDLVIVIATQRWFDTVITVNNNGGQTWNTLTEVTSGTGDGSTMTIFWCQFNGTWSANPSFAFTEAFGTKSAVMQVFRSTSPSFSLWSLDGDTCSTPGTDNTNPIEAVGRTTLHDNVITLAVFFIYNDSTWTFSSGTGWIDIPANYRNNIGGVSDTSTSYAYKFNKVINSTGNVSKNASSQLFGNQVQVSFYET